MIPGLSLSIALQRSWLPERAPFQALVLDRTVLATIPGEAITEIGWELKRRATAKGFDRAFVVGLANEHISYITTYQEYIRAEYEGTSTLFGPQTGDMVMNASEAVMDIVKP